MPLYEYYCADCQTKFDALRPMSQADTPIQCKALTNCAFASAVLTLPESMTDDCSRRHATADIVTGVEKPPSFGLNLKPVEEIAA